MLYKYIYKSLNNENNKLINLNLGFLILKQKIPFKFNI